VLSAPFKLPGWARCRPLPGSKWTFAPVTDAIGLVGAGTRMSNCAATYAPRCRSGHTVIAEIRRPITPKATGKCSLPRDGGDEIGALVEIGLQWDTWHLVQARGFANGEARASAVEAVKRLLDLLNSGVEG
jgi:hypothetical protein